MPNRLTLLRHAKSSWNEHNQHDFDRPLNKRGEKDAPDIGRLLRQQKFSPQLIVSSSAVRARITAVHIAREIEYPLASIQFSRSLYLASAQTLLKTLANLATSYQDVLIVGHNPGITSAANLVGNARVDNMPTCGAISFLFKINDWRELAVNPGEMNWFFTPKMSLKQDN
jgi:phosphohistidine phosphatase